jgi:hypothetical protein
MIGMTPSSGMATLCTTVVQLTPVLLTATDTDVGLRIPSPTGCTKTEITLALDLKSNTRKSFQPSPILMCGHQKVSSSLSTFLGCFPLSRAVLPVAPHSDTTKGPEQAGAEDLKGMPTYCPHWLLNWRTP